MKPRGTRSASARRWAIGHHQFDLVRTDGGIVYLSRWWLIKTPWGGIAVHRIAAPDARPTLHDHPFAFVAFVLWGGGYIERRLDPKTMRVDEHHRVRRVNRMRTHDAHSITALASPVVWTLLLVGPHRRTWGFIEPVGPDEHGDGLALDRWRWTRHTTFDSGHTAKVVEQ